MGDWRVNLGWEAGSLIVTTVLLTSVSSSSACHSTITQCFQNHSELQFHHTSSFSE